MNEKTDKDYRRECKCNGCKVVERALGLLDDIALSDESMGWHDTGKLCEARELLAHEIGATYNVSTERYERTSIVPDDSAAPLSPDGRYQS